MKKDPTPTLSVTIELIASVRDEIQRRFTSLYSQDRASGEPTMYPLHHNAHFASHDFRPLTDALLSDRRAGSGWSVCPFRMRSCQATAWTSSNGLPQTSDSSSRKYYAPRFGNWLGYQFGNILLSADAANLQVFCCEALLQPQGSVSARDAPCPSRVS